MLELLKILVQPVVLERDADGKVVGERVSDPVPLYSRELIVEFLDRLDGEIAAANASASNGGQPSRVVVPTFAAPG